MSANSTVGEDRETITKDDAAWVLANSFLILTMQTGFGMLECGSVSPKNTANIMVKNVVDVSLGGLSYWMFGYALSFGKPSNFFCGLGSFFVRTHDESLMGSFYTHYVFQFSFATTATTIVSGAVAERMKLSSYIVFSFVNTLVYCIPASWCWNQGVGWLNLLGFFDYAGSCVVHLNGGISALVACLMIGPRYRRYEEPNSYQMSSPTTAMCGMFMLCWAWLAFNCGSAYGLTGKLWKVVAKVAVTTLQGSIGGGLTGLTLSGVIKKGKYDISWIINSVLGGLVGVTASCSVTDPVESLLLGMFCGGMAVGFTPLFNYWKIDDPVGAMPVHLVCGFIATIFVGILGKNDSLDQLRGHNGLLHGGGFYLLGIQLLGAVCVAAWSAASTFLIVLIIDKTIGLRVDLDEEILGADLVEHDFHSDNLAERIEDAWKSEHQKPQLFKVLERIYLEIHHDQNKLISGDKEDKLERMVESKLSSLTKRLKTGLYRAQHKFNHRVRPNGSASVKTISNLAVTNDSQIFGHDYSPFSPPLQQFGSVSKDLSEGETPGAKSPVIPLEEDVFHS